MPPRLVVLLAAVVCLTLAAAPLPAQAPPTYVGSQACGECHPEQYERFSKYSKKAHSFQSVAKMRRGLAQAELKRCYECHTTGHGQPGGFVSEGETPHLKDAGCEVCHGQGGRHVASQDSRDIKAKLKASDCERCHNAERVGAFRFKPVIHGGAH